MQAGGTWGHVELTGIADLVKECVSACIKNLHSHNVQEYTLYCRDGHNTYMV